jgi:hypothetical protein
VNDQVQRVSADEDDADEVWNRLTDEPDIRGVEAARIDDLGGWLVEITVQEFFRQDPLGVELRQRVASALRSFGGSSAWPSTTTSHGSSPAHPREKL